MKFVLLALAVIGYCFDINSGCCGKENNGNSKGCCNCCRGGDDGNGGGGVGSKGKKSKKSKPNKKKKNNIGKGGLAGMHSSFKKGNSNPSNSADKDPAGAKGDGNGVVIKIFSNRVEITDGKDVINVEEITSEDKIKKLVHEDFVGSTKVYKYEEDCRYYTPNVIVDNEITATAYFAAIIKIMSDDNYYVICVNREGGDFGGLFVDIDPSSMTILSSEGATSMNAMFLQCTNLSDIDIVKINTVDVTDMASMFSGCSSLESLDLKKFDTSNVKNMSNMFSGCSSLKSLDFEEFDTSSVTDIGAMFSGCSSLESLDLSNFNTSGVSDMSSMFSGCSSLKMVKLSNFNTSNVTNMRYMFRECSALKSLDLSNFITSSVVNMECMFYRCSALEELTLGDTFVIDKVKDMRSMFEECGPIKELDLSKFDFDMCDEDSLSGFISESDILKIIFGKNPTINCLTAVLNAEFEPFNGGITWIRKKLEEH